MRRFAARAWPALIVHLEAAARAAGAGGLVIITGFDNAGAQAAYRASGYANWALAIEEVLPERMTNEERRTGDKAIPSAVMFSMSLRNNRRCHGAA